MALQPCPQCNTPARPGTACPHCGAATPPALLSAPLDLPPPQPAYGVPPTQTARAAGCFALVAIAGAVAAAWIFSRGGT